MEFFPATFAPVSRIVVPLNVLAEITGRVKLVAAQLAFMFGFEVANHVQVEAVPRFEPPVVGTNWAFERPFGAVRGQMPRELAPLVERLAAFGALVRLHARVSSRMPVKI